MKTIVTKKEEKLRNESDDGELQEVSECLSNEYEGKEEASERTKEKEQITR
jgi:hypothetical protein